MSAADIPVEEPLEELLRNVIAEFNAKSTAFD